MGHKHSRETKDLISRRRREYLEANPDKVPYLLHHHSKGRSFPEKYFKEVFDAEGLVYEEQFRVGLYALDFAVLDRMVDIEIHGNQHYDDPRIVASDERRREKLRGLGWHVIEIRWSHFMALSADERRAYVVELMAAVAARAPVDVPPQKVTPIDCATCGATIRKPRRGQKCCNRACTAALAKQKPAREPITCGTCGTVIATPRTTQSYCSRECRDTGTGLAKRKAAPRRSVSKPRSPRPRAPSILPPSIPGNICPACQGPSERKFCSTRCAGLACRKVSASSEEIVLYLESNGFNYEEAGRHFGCSGNAIKKRAKKLTLLPVKKSWRANRNLNPDQEGKNL